MKQRAQEKEKKKMKNVEKKKKIPDIKGSTLSENSPYGIKILGKKNMTDLSPSCNDIICSFLSVRHISNKQMESVYIVYMGVGKTKKLCTGNSKKEKEIM